MLLTAVDESDDSDEDDDEDDDEDEGIGGILRRVHSPVSISKQAKAARSKKNRAHEETELGDHDQKDDERGTDD